MLDYSAYGTPNVWPKMPTVHIYTHAVPIYMFIRTKAVFTSLVLSYFISSHLI